MKTVPVVAVAVACCVGAALAGDAWLLRVGASLGDTTRAIDAMAAWRPEPGHVVSLGNGDVVAKLGPAGREWTRLDHVPPVLADAFTAAEDRGFWTNPGIDPAAIARAAFGDVTGTGRRAGASTITQQLAKIALLGGRGGTPALKARQAVLALRIAARLPKGVVMETYLNRVYLGRSWVGVAEAANGYFGKRPADLDAAQSAMLAGLARNPSANDPVEHPVQATRRRNQVIGAMERDGLLAPAAAASALAEPLDASPHPRRQPVELVPGPEGIGWATDLAKREAVGAVADREGLALTVDPALQADAAMALETGLMGWEASTGGWRGRLGRTRPPAADGRAELGALGASATAACMRGCPAWAAPAVVVSASPAAVVLDDGTRRWKALPRGFDWIADGSASRSAARLARGDVVLAGDPWGGDDGGAVAQPTSLQGSAVVLSADDGSVLAVVGGMSWTPGGFDRATEAMRPPGSAFKPFVYLAAVERGWGPDTTVFDMPLTVPDGRGEWSPSDDDGLWEGAIPMAQALSESRNAPAARMAWTLGIDALSDVASRFGIYEVLRSPSAALGAQETTNLALCSAYATLAAGGMRSRPHVTVVRAAGGAWRVASADDAATLARMMTGVLKEGGTAEGLAPFAAGMAAGGHPVSAKTGTSQDFHDAWMSGFAGRVAVSVHVGYDLPATMGSHAFGAAVAGPVFASIMRSAERLGLLGPAIPAATGMGGHGG